jgi:CRISPR system Cascade subunit CasA
MNLTTDPWIPIVWNNGGPGSVSLVEAFERGHEMRDLSVRPHERVALMRLLICVAQAALDGPADLAEWKVCGPRTAPSAVDYLHRWRGSFELFGNGPRLLQMTNLRKPAKKSGPDDNDEGNAVSKLDLALATGNNTTLFDNAGGSDRTFSPAELALNLLTFQCFSPCGTIGVALWDGKPTLGWSSYPKAAPGKSAHAPCVAGNMLHSYLRRPTLLDSLHSNVITRDQVELLCGPSSWGKPVWESLPSGPDDKESIRNASLSYLGRLVPLSRAIALTDERTLILANGMDYPAYPEWREPAATVVVRSKNSEPTRVVLPASAERGTWRELHALTVIAADRFTTGGPAALKNLAGDADFDLWAGGLVAAGNGKLVDSTEGVFHVPAEMLHETGQRIYEGGVRLAETVEFRLRRAVSVYHKQLGDNVDRPEMRSRRQLIHSAAASQFWTDVELAVARLLDVAENPQKLGLPAKWYTTDWGRAVLAAMRAAFEHACPRETPRQMHAYALGLEALFTEAAGKKEAAEEELELGE